MFWRHQTNLLSWLVTGLGLALMTTAQPPPRAAGPAQGELVQFDRAAPYGSEPELMRRLGYRRAGPAYALTQEHFRVLAPESYSTNASWGLLVWVSPGDDPRIPSSWEKELADRRLLFVAACRAGNERDAIQRCRLALDAAGNMCRRYRIDSRRLYIGGFSGGGRIASIMAVAYADLFRGAMAICGADFYAAVPGGTGQVYPPSYKPDPALVRRAQASGRFVLVTGEHDPNRDNTRSIAEHGFKRSGFKQVHYFEIPGLGHALPSAADLRRALAALDEGPADLIQQHRLAAPSERTGSSP